MKDFIKTETKINIDHRTSTIVYRKSNIVNRKSNPLLLKQSSSLT